LVAIDLFLEAFYNRFQNHYFAQMHRCYHALDERVANRGPPPPYRSKIPVLIKQVTAAKTPRSRSSMAHHRS